MTCAIGLIVIGFIAGVLVALGAAIILMWFHARAMEAEYEVERLFARTKPFAPAKPRDPDPPSWPPYRSPGAAPAPYRHHAADCPFERAPDAYR